MTWGKSLSRSDRQVLAKVAAFALTDVLRGHSSNALESLGHNARELGGSVLFASHSSALLEMVNKAIAARQVEKSRPNLANMVLGHIRRRDRQVNYIIGDDEDAGYM